MSPDHFTIFREYIMTTAIKDPGQLYTFTVLSGEHQGNKRVYKQGQMFRSQYPLDELFPGKFQRMPNSPAPLDDSDQAAEKGSQAKRVAAPEAPFDFEDATDVTHMFAVAQTAGLTVYKNSVGGFGVAEAGAKKLENLAGQTLKSKKQVNQFLADFKPSADIMD